MQVNELLLKKSCMPIISVEISQQFFEENLQDKTSKLKHTIAIQGGIEKNEKPTSIKVKIDVKVTSEESDIKLHFLQEDIYEPTTGFWDSKEDAMKAIKELAVPATYRKLSAFVRSVTKRAGLSSIVMPPVSSLRSNENK